MKPSVSARQSFGLQLFELQTLLFVLPPPSSLQVNVCGCVAVKRVSAGTDTAQRSLESVYYCGFTELESFPQVLCQQDRAGKAAFVSLPCFLFPPVFFFFSCHLYFIYLSVKVFKYLQKKKKTQINKSKT